MPHFQNTHWEKWEGSVFLGTEKNPKSGRIYDYWIVQTGSELRDLSWTCKFGEDDSDYCSGPVCYMDERDFSIKSLKMIESDYIFGENRAKYFSLLYLAVKKRPLIEE